MEKFLRKESKMLGGFYNYERLTIRRTKRSRLNLGFRFHFQCQYETRDFPDFYGQFFYELQPRVAPNVNTAVVYGKWPSVSDR